MGEIINYAFFWILISLSWYAGKNYQDLEKRSQSQSQNYGLVLLYE